MVLTMIELLLLAQSTGCFDETKKMQCAAGGCCFAHQNMVDATPAIKEKMRAKI